MLKNVWAIVDQIESQPALRGELVESSVLEHAGRYGLHTMYCQDGRVVGSRFRHNVAGCAIMFSNGLRLERNEFAHNRGPRTYGVLLRDCSAGSAIRWPR